MKTHIYDVSDDDVLDAWFSEEAPARPLKGFTRMHGKLVFDGSLDGPLNDGSCVIIRDEEYIILLQIYHVNPVQLSSYREVVVHKRHFDTETSTAS